MTLEYWQNVDIKNLTYTDFVSKFEIFETFKQAQHSGMEAHHIVPICVQKGASRKNPKDDRCIRLTILEHIIAHYLLAKENPKSSKLLFAFYAMVNFKCNTLPTEGEHILEELLSFSIFVTDCRIQKKVYQYSREGELLATYSSIIETRRRLKISRSYLFGNLNRTLQDISKYPYLFSFNPLSPIEVISFIQEVKLRSRPQIYVYNLEGLLLYIFNDIPSTAERLNISKSCLGTRLRGEINYLNLSRFPYIVSYKTLTKEQILKIVSDNKFIYRGKSIAKYSRDGTLLEVFATIKEASIGLCLNERTINFYLDKGTPEKYSFYLTRYSDSKEKESIVFYSRVPIYKYSLQGELIDFYENIATASKALNFSSDTIRRYAEKGTPKNFNYILSKSALTKEQLALLITKRQGRTQKCKVLLYSLENTFLKEFESKTELSNYLGVSRTTINKYINGIWKPSQRFPYIIKESSLQ